MEELLNLLAELVYGNETIMEVNYVNSDRRNHSAVGVNHLPHMVRRDAEKDTNQGNADRNG